MEVLDVFFYKLSRALIALKELWINYYYTATRVEQNYFLLLVFLIVLFFAMLFVLILRLNFNRRIKKLGFVNITHINIANEVYNKNWFLRAVFFIWNFKKLVIVETTPFAAKMENEQDEVDVPQIVDSKMKKSVKPVEKQLEKQLEKPMEQPVKNVPSKVFLSKDVEDYIEERISLRTLTLEESLQDYVISLIKNNSDIDLQTIVTPKPVIDEPIDDFEEPIEVLEETVEETIEDVQEEPATVYEEPVFIQVESVVQEEPEKVQEEPATVYEEPVFIQEEPEVQEEPIVPKKVVEEVIDEDAEFDAFFNKDKGKKYVVCKHPISGWQVKKEGSKRASRLFNTKKQAINFAIKSKFDYEIK